MKKAIILLLATVSYSTFLAQTTTKSHFILFESASASISPEQEQILADFLSECADYQSITLSGHTDDVGDVEYNKSLSMCRVKAALANLESQGFSVQSYTYRGEHVPIDNNTSDLGRQQNRRVEVTINIPAESAGVSYTMEDVMEALMPTSQVYCIDNSVDNAFM